MKRRHFLPLTILLALTFSLSALSLIGGSPMTDVPDVVRLVFTNGWVCSGVYIDDYTILTAAHCLVAEDASRPLDIGQVETTEDTKLPVTVRKLIPNPSFHSQQWPAYDVGIVKTTKNEMFQRRFSLSNTKPAHQGTVSIYGCGRTSTSSPERGRRTGTNSYLRIGAVLFFVGPSSPDIEGRHVSIAANDSGGPVIDEGGAVIAIATTTTAVSSSHYHMPILSTATSIMTGENRGFVLSHMGITRD